MKNVKFLGQTAAALIIAAIAFTGCKKDPVNVTGVTLNKTALMLAEGSSETLVATVAPADAENQTVSWVITEGNAVMVDISGKVTAVKTGTATITVTTKDGGFTAECVVTVIKPALTLAIGASKTLVAAVAPDDAIDKTVDWTSSNEAVATVDATGKVTAIAEGTATITATAKDGGFTAECIVTVIYGMTLTTRMWWSMTIFLAGTGTAIIDWGDGSTSKTVTPSDQRYSLSFPSDTSHTIVIAGKNITYFGCFAMELTALDVTKNTVLTWLECAFNRLTSLDVTKNTALTYLYCTDNQLTNLDVSNNTALTRLNCGSNQLTSLDVSKNTVLTQLYCDSNQLTSLDVSNNTALTRLECQNNKLDAEGLNALFGTLPSNTGTKHIFIRNNPGTDGCDRSIATNKGWTVYAT